MSQKIKIIKFKDYAAAYSHTTERLSKTVGGVTTVYPNDVYNRGGSTTTIHITDPSGIELVTIEGNGTATTTVYSHQDHLGSTNVLTTNTGTLKEVSDYYPYGAPRVQTTYTGTSEQRKYLSEDYDADSNLSYLNARFLDSARGQFLTQDPVFWEVGQTSDGNAVLRNPQAQNSYSYSQNSPIVNKDPMGRIGLPFLISAVAYTLDALGAIELASNWNDYRLTVKYPSAYTSEDRTDSLNTALYESSSYVYSSRLKKVESIAFDVVKIFADGTRQTVKQGVQIAITPDDLKNVTTPMTTVQQPSKKQEVISAPKSSNSGSNKSGSSFTQSQINSLSSALKKLSNALTVLKKKINN